MKLILTEKPSVAFDVAKALGKPEKHDGYLKVGDYTVAWLYGHLTEIDDSEYQGKWDVSELPILPEKFKYRVQKGKGKQFKVVKELLDKANEVIISTDAGREGELLARLVLMLAGLKEWNKVKRLWTSLSLTKEVVRKELKNLKPAKEFDSLYYSGLARQHADWIVGINLTRLLTLLANDRSVWSVGRVQTPVLKMIVEREREIEDFTPVPYGVVKAVLSKSGEEFLSYLDVEKLKERGEVKDLLSPDFAKEITGKVKGESSGAVRGVKRRVKREPPPRLYSLTALQRDANKLYGYTLDRTLEIAQKLYQDYKVISYPRTDAEYLGEGNRGLAKEVLKRLLSAKDSLGEVGKVLDKELIDRVDSVGKRVFDDSKLTDHHAIIPLYPLPESAKEDERRIYQLILKRFVAVFLPDYTYEATTVSVEIANYPFVSRGRRVVDAGWRVLYGGVEDSLLPELKEGDSVEVVNVEVEEKETQPPPRWTEGSLVEELKRIGIGTPATRAPTIETLKERGYVYVKSKKLYPTEKAFKLIEVLKGSKVSSPEMTGEWERELEKIYTESKGELGYREFLESIKGFTKDEVEKLKKVKVESTPQATGKMLSLARKLSFITGEKLETTDYDKVKEFIDRNLKKTKEGLFTCSCGGEVVTLGDKGYRCQSCGKTVWRKFLGKMLSPKQVEKLFKGEKVFVKGLKSKSGKKFNAYLVLTDKGIDISFPE